MMKTLSLYASAALFMSAYAATPEPPKTPHTHPTTTESNSTQATSAQNQTETVTKTNESLYIRGNDFLAFGDHQAAYDIAQKLVESESDNPSYNLLYAQSALALGKKNDALGAYERILIVDESNTTALLGLAEIYQHEGSTVLALEALRQARITPTTTAEQRSMIEAKIAELEGPVVKQPESTPKPIDESKRHRHLSGFVLLGLEYDSNAVNYPEVDRLIPNPLEVLTQTVAQDISHLEALGLGWTYDPGEPSGFFMKTKANLFNQMYYHNTNLNLQFTNVGADLTYEIDRHQVMLPLSYDYVWYDKEAMLSALGYGLSYQYALSAQTLLFAQILQKIKTFDANSTNDSTLTWLEIGASKAINEGTTLKGTLAWGVEESDNKDRIDATIMEADVNVAYRLSQRFGLSANYTYRSSEFQNNDKDTNHDISVGFSTILQKRFEVTARVGYIDNSSTNDDYDYSKVLLGITWQMKF